MIMQKALILTLIFLRGLHSKLQRAATSLAVFNRPQEPRPSSAEAKQIMKDLISLKRVISIPGFENWFDFTEAYSTEFYQVLADTEIKDTLALQFLKGLRFQQSPNDFLMGDIAIEVNEYKRLTFVLLKMPTLAAHSWLLNSFEGSTRPGLKKENSLKDDQHLFI